jgi:hypothetical protein
MAYKQLIGKQGKSRFVLLYYQNFVQEYFFIDNTSPTLSFSPVNPIEQNYRGDFVEPGSKLIVNVSLEILNVGSEYINILKLFDAINKVKQFPNIFTLVMTPLYVSESSWCFPVLVKEGWSLDNIKKFMNTAQKISIDFVSKFAINAMPIDTSDGDYPDIETPAVADLTIIAR